MNPLMFPGMSEDYDDLVELRTGQKEIVSNTSGILEFSNLNDTWLKLIVNGMEVYFLKPGSKGLKFMFPIRKGDTIRIFGPGKDYGVDAKIYCKKSEGLNERRVPLPSDSNEWVDFFMDLASKVISFKLETDCGFILIYSEDTIKPGTTRLSYFHTSMNPCKCYHCQFSREALINSLPLTNIKLVTAIYK